MSAPDRAGPERGAPPEFPVSGGQRAPAAPGRELMLVQPAVAVSSRAMRRSVRRWLDQAGWPLMAVEDIELAVNEAVANVIDHAYLDHDPGPIHLHAWITSTPAASPTTPVTGAGPALAVLAVPMVAAPGFPAAAIPVPSPPPTRPGGSAAGPVPPPRCVATVAVSDRGRWSPERRTIDPAGHRGHGLGVMTGLMAAVHLQRSAPGTTVVLVSHDAPA